MYPSTQGSESPNDTSKTSKQNQEKICNEINEDELTCNVCQNAFNIISLNIDQPTLQKIKSTMNLGTRWHCQSCLKNPKESNFLLQEISELKSLLNKELHEVRKHFDEQLQILQVSMTAKFENYHQPLHKHTNSVFSYADAVGKYPKNQTQQEIV